ncbi:unnamed protein product [Choristocarpus tenellus]
MPFESTWEEDSSGFHHLEHVNINMPEHGPITQLYFDTLLFAPDSRRSQNIDKGSGTIWANIGTSQLHMPHGEPQVVPGTIGLIYPDVEEIFPRLRQAAGNDALEGTKFAWVERTSKTAEVTGPFGNKLRLHSQPGGDKGALFDPRGGQLPSPPSLGLGLAYVHLRARRGTAGGIGRFYRSVFGAEVLESGEAETVGMGGGRRVGALVRTGPSQHLGFFEVEEGEEAPSSYDGHHVCLYLTEECFRSSFLELERMGLIFINPRRNFGRADTLEKALEERQYRVKDIVDPTSGELLHELEHEIRSTNHPSYPVGRIVVGPSA